MQPRGVQGTRPSDDDARPEASRPSVQRVEAVDVLARIDGEEHAILADPRREGELDEDAVDGRVRVELGHEAEHLVLGGGRGEPVEPAAHADLVRHLLLVARVDLARGVVADEHDGEARRAPVRRRKRATSAFTPSRTVWLMALPSIVRAVMARSVSQKRPRRACATQAPPRPDRSPAAAPPSPCGAR